MKAYTLYTHFENLRVSSVRWRMGSSPISSCLARKVPTVLCSCTVLLEKNHINGDETSALFGWQLNSAVQSHLNIDLLLN